MKLANLQQINQARDDSYRSARIQWYPGSTRAAAGVPEIVSYAVIQFKKFSAMCEVAHTSAWD